MGEGRDFGFVGGIIGAQLCGGTALQNGSELIIARRFAEHRTISYLCCSWRDAHCVVTNAPERRIV